MLQILEMFFRAKNTNPWTVLICLLFAGVAGGIGLASLLPLLTVAMDIGKENPSFVSQAVTDGLSFIGLRPELPQLLSLVVLAVAVKSLLNFVAMRHAGYASVTVAMGFRTDIIKQLMNVQWRYFTEQPLGRLANTVSLDAYRSGQTYVMAASLVSNAIQMLIYITLAFVVSWKLALIALMIGGSIGLSLHFLVQMARKAGFRETQYTRELLTFLTDALNSMKPLKAMSRQAHFSELFDKKIRAVSKALRRQVVSREARRSAEEILTVLCLGMTFYILIEVSSYQISEVLVMGVLLYQTTRNIGKIQDSFQKAVVLESPFRSVQDLISQTREANEKVTGHQIPTLDKGCRFESVNFSFKNNAVLTDVSMEIPAGQITVLSGPSGGGKTTISDLLVGLYTPDQGRIFVDDLSLENLDLHAWRRMIGYVPQELILFHDTIFANVTLGARQVDDADVRSALELAEAWEFVSTLEKGMMSEVGEKGAKLSGGQRQRIALARALVTKPKLLVLDEVTSALDPETERDICSGIRRLSDGITILAITHRPAFLEIADKIYKVENGQVEDKATKRILAPVTSH